MKKKINTFLRRLGYLVSFPIALFFSLIFPVYRIRFIGLQASRIGHYALNTELMLCAIDAGYDNKKQKTFFFNMAKPCNEQLLKMWKRILPFFPISILAIQVDFFMSKILRKKYTNDYIKKKYEPCSGVVDEAGFLKKFPSHLFFTESEKKIGEKILLQLGVPFNKKYILLIVRDSAYLKNQYPENDWSYHNHRDAAIENYTEMMKYLADLGYYVIRMGKHVNSKLSINHPRIIDYANHALRSDFMDIYLSSGCYFCVSTCTGLDCVAQIFRRPILMTNISPAFGELLMWYPCKLYIPKLLKSSIQDKVLTFSQTAKIGHQASKNFLCDIKNKNLSLIENSPEQLVDVTKEMLARLSNNWIESDDDKTLQEKYWIIYKKNCPVPVEEVYIKIGSDFLRSYQGLLEY